MVLVIGREEEITRQPLVVLIIIMTMLLNVQHSTRLIDFIDVIYLGLFVPTHISIDVNDSSRSYMTLMVVLYIFLEYFICTYSLHTHRDYYPCCFPSSCCCCCCCCCRCWAAIFFLEAPTSKHFPAAAAAGPDVLMMMTPPTFSIKVSHSSISSKESSWAR